MPKAETQVNSFSMKVKASLPGVPAVVLPRPRNRAIATTNRAEAIATPMARSTTRSGSSLSRITTTSSSRRVERVAATRAAKVVVLMPPPVPPGLAPMNISTIISSRPASEMVAALRGTVLKPAVRQVIDWNRVTCSLSKRVSFCTMPSVAKCSVKSRPRVPTTIRPIVVRTTSRVCRLSRRMRCRRKRFTQRSLATRQPIPPITIRAAIVPFTHGLLR